MTPSLQALLYRVIDYAGMFPPARLPLEEAVENFARYRAESTQPPNDYARMLNMFVCPAARAEELAEHELWLQQREDLIVVGTGAEDTPTALEAIDDDLRRSRGLMWARFGTALRLSLEVKLPPSAGASYVPQLYDAIRNADERHETRVSWIALEVPLGEIVAELAAAVASLEGHSGWFRLKFRTGGLESAAFPAPAELARAIAACRDHGVAWKATAGLHHPLRHDDEAVGTHMHGFLNVLVAATLAHAHRWDAAQLEEVLADEDPADFAFDDEQLRWRDTAVGIEAIKAARGGAMVSFGSCSFDEPVEGLRELGLL